MNTHSTHHTTLLRRRFAGDPSLTPGQRRELDTHLLFCPQCNYDYAELLRPQNAEMADELLRTLENALTADLVTPYLRDLAQTFRDNQPLTGFQRLLWRFVQRDRETLGRFRLLEADVWLSGGLIR